MDRVREISRTSTVVPTGVVFSDTGDFEEALALELNTTPPILIKHIEAGIKPSLAFTLAYDETAKRFYFTRYTRGNQNTVVKVYDKRNNFYRDLRGDENGYLITRGRIIDDIRGDVVYAGPAAIVLPTVDLQIDSYWVENRGSFYVNLCTDPFGVAVFYKLLPGTGINLDGYQFPLSVTSPVPGQEVRYGYVHYRVDW